MRLEVIPFDSIEIGERFRKDMGDIIGLAQSIEENGLIQPIAVLSTPDESKPYLLLAGGRRMAALERLQRTEVPVRIYEKSLDEKEIRSIELTENIKRKEMDWEEEIRLKKRLHELQTEIHGKAIQGKKDSEGWSTTHTADLLGTSRSSVIKDIQLAAAVESNPELFAGCNNKSEAAKRIRKITKAVDITNRSEEVQKSKSHSGAIKSLINCYMVNDFFKGVLDIPKESINIVEIDPPYGVDLVKQKNSQDSFSMAEYNEIPYEQYLDFISNVLSECYRVMTPNSWLICWFGPDPWFSGILELLRNHNFTVRGIPGIWVKPNGQTLSPRYHLASAYEMFFYARKGNPEINAQGRTNVFNFNPIPPHLKTHPTERPVELLTEILKTFSLPGDRLLVPFLGSGNTLLAGYNYGLSGVGFDLSQEYKNSFIVKTNALFNGEALK